MINHPNYFPILNQSLYPRKDKCHACQKNTFKYQNYESNLTEKEIALQEKRKGKYSLIINEATSKIRKGKINEAYKILKTAIEEKANHSDIYYLYGEICRIKGDLKESEKHLLNSIKFTIHPYYSYYSLAIIYFIKKDFQTAIKLSNIFLTKIV